MNDHISDMIVRIKNAYKVGKKDVSMPHTKVCAEIARVLVENKYLASASVEGKEKKTLFLVLLYVEDHPVLSYARRISKPGVRIYKKSKELTPILSGMGLSIVSTSKGVMTGHDARKNKLGGEVLLELW